MPFFKKLRRFSRHKKLCEEWALANSRECVEGSGGGGGGGGGGEGGGGSAGSGGVSHEEPEDTSEAKFTLKYLGSTLVETPSSEEATAEAIKTVITMAKASGKKLQRVSLSVSLRGIRMTDLATEEDQLQVSIYRISYCSADAAHDHVFAFIATNLNETMECHAFLCPKRKMAQTVTLTVAQAFNTAYEAWRLSQTEARIQHARDKSPSLAEDAIEYNDEKTGATKTGNRYNGQWSNATEAQKNLLIDLSVTDSEMGPMGNSWVCFEEESGPDGRKAQKKGNTNSIPMTTLTGQVGAGATMQATATATATASTSTAGSHHVVPRPSVGFKMQNAWGESARSVDLMCS